MKLRTAMILVCALFALGFLPADGVGQVPNQIIFMKIADTSMLIPGGSGTFLTFGAPAIDSGNVAFFAVGCVPGNCDPYSVYSPAGIYKYTNGMLSRVADRNTEILSADVTNVLGLQSTDPERPGGFGIRPSDHYRFMEFSSPSIDGENVAFLGSNIAGPKGFFTDVGGLTALISNGSMVPAGEGFVSVNPGAPYFSEGTIAFSSLNAWTVQGVYTIIGGSLNVVADEYTPVPDGSGNFLRPAGSFAFGYVALDNGKVVFVGRNEYGDLGIYTDLDGLLWPVIKRGDAIPNSSYGPFTSFHNTMLSQGNIVFNGFGVSNYGGIFTIKNGSLSVVADTNTMMPNHTTGFRNFWPPSIDGDKVAFMATGWGPTDQAIYVTSDQGLIQVVALQDSIDGKIVSGLNFDREGLSGNQVTLSASFADGSQGVYIATVVDANRPPVLVPIDNRSIPEGTTLQFTITATDPDGDTLEYSVSNLPAGATFDAASGDFTWTPDFNQSGNYPNVLFTVTDNGNPPKSASETITISVGNVNRPPVINPIGNKFVNENNLLEFTVLATDPDGDTLTFSASNLPAGATFDPTSQTFSWAPTPYQAGNYSVLFTVTDNSLPTVASTSDQILITVNNVNRPPILNKIGDKTMNEGELLQFTITATDPDGDLLTYESENLPSGASFDPLTHVFSWTPGYDQKGTYDIEFSVKDNGNPLELATEIIKISVSNTNRSPVFTSVGSQQTMENQPLQFYVTATDYDGDAITYSTGPLPVGASFDPNTRLFSWRPGAAQAGPYTIFFYATDNGTPSLIGETTVAITVGDVPTPVESADRIVQTVVGLNLPKSVENSYMTNLKKVGPFVQNGRILQAVIQLDIFIVKVIVDEAQGDISRTAGNNLINMAINLINTVRR